MITAPYNFVPLSDKVVSPHWAKLVSHDIPFKDSESGVLELTITAESPIYVRNGMARNAADSDKNAFNNIDGKYFIPGSSIKGMLRSVMEIMSFGRMGNKVNDHRYSVRDFHNPDIYKMSELSRDSLCGWLYKSGEQYFINDCGKPGRISHETLDALCVNGTKMSNYYKIAGNITPKTKSAKSKYDIFSFKKDTNYFTTVMDAVGRPVCKIDNNGDQGTIVLSGQPSVRKDSIGSKPSGKHLEFVFFENQTLNKKVEEEAIKNFFFAYYNHDVNQQKEDWKWRKSQLDKGEKIPVFFRYNQDGTFKDIGLTLLYKITYNLSIRNAIDSQQKEANAFDLAEIIFGYTQDKEALKGRVHVGHAFATNKVTPLTEVTNVLSGPKASYYPSYIEQKVNGIGKVSKYKTFMDGDVSIRGWKRYPVHVGNVKPNAPSVINGKVNDLIGTKFIPLPAKTIFTLQINYHNLRKEELGALISAITFHNTAGLFHSIGSGKPLGYGKTTFIITNLEDHKKEQLLKAYELYMDFALKNSTPLWFQLPQIKELFAMAKPGQEDIALQYMKITKKNLPSDPLDFSTAKSNQLALQKYSVISKNNIDVKALGTEAELKKAKDKYDQEIALFIGQQDLKSAMKAILNNHQTDFETALKAKKRELIIQLNDRKLVVEKNEKDKKNKLQIIQSLQKAAAGIPPEWQIITDFGNLANRIPAWQKKLPNAIISESFQNDLVALIEKIIKFDLSLKKPKKDWKGDFKTNGTFKMIEVWVGETNAQALFNKINT